MTDAGETALLLAGVLCRCSLILSDKSRLLAIRHPAELLQHPPDFFLKGGIGEGGRLVLRFAPKNAVDRLGSGGSNVLLDDPHHRRRTACRGKG